VVRQPVRARAERPIELREVWLALSSRGDVLDGPVRPSWQPLDAIRILIEGIRHTLALLGA